MISNIYPNDNPELQQQIFDNFKHPRPQRVYENYIYGVTLAPPKYDPEGIQTYAATEDDALYTLLIHFEVVEFNNGHKILGRKYQRQVIEIILNHARCGKVKDFIFNKSDIQGHLKEQLTIENIGGNPKEYCKIVKEILTSAVRRLFEELDTEYITNIWPANYE
jgi:hypothetical protein